jgi:serine/threonine protein kinase
MCFRIGCRVPEECSQEVSDLIDACLQTDPHQRPTASEVLQLLQASCPSD